MRQHGEETLLYVDGEEVSPEEYRAAVTALHITPLAFVKQAEVDAIARKTPIELTQFFEEMSGSVDFAADYDRYRLESESSHEAVNLIEKRRRAALSEKRHISVRIDEATKFRELTERKEKVQVESALYQLFHYKRRLDEATEESTALALQKHDLTTETEGVAGEVQHLQRVANDTRGQYTAAKAESDSLEQRLREARAQQSVLRESRDILDERLHSTLTKQSLQQDAVRQREEDIVRMRHEREEIETEINSLPAVDEFESEIAEYNTLRERASRQFSDVTHALRAAVQDRNGAQRAVDDLIAQRDVEETSRRRIEDRQTLTREDHRKVTARLTDVAQKIDAVNANLGLLQRAQEVDREKQQRLLAEKRGLERKYDDTKRSLDTNKRKARFAEALSSMQRLIPGVYGRFIELCRPVHAQYATAVFTGVGGYADAIVVRDQQVAMRCIDFLREQAAGSALFLPLRSLVPPRIRAPKSAPLLSSVLVFDDVYKPAVDFVCGSTAVEATIKAASKLSRADNIKVVTKDGAVVEPDGIFTGGATREDAQLEHCDVRGLEKSIVDLEKALADLGDRIEKHDTEIKRAEEQKLSLGPQREHYTQRKRELEEKLKYLEADVRTTDREIAETDRRIAEARAVLSEREAAVQNMDLRQAEIDRAIFADFCARAGVADIRQFEVTRLQTFEERYARRLSLQSRLAQLESFISAEERADPARLESKLADDAVRLRTERDAAVTELARLELEFRELSAAHERAREERVRWQAADDANQAELRQQRRALQQQNMRLEQADKAQAAADHTRDTALQNAQAVLQQARLTNLQLPRLKEQDAPPEATPSSFTQEEIDRTELEAIDFHGLAAARRARPTETEFDAAVHEYEEQLGKLRAELAQIRPDLKSDQRIQAVEKELTTMAEEQEQLRRAAAESKTQFTKALYDAIDRTIDKVYKRLTRVRDQPNRSGTAYLALEDTEEPYLGGVKFTAMPPHKRFRDLEQLSGGEKAVASLALVIAMQKHLAAPFILMDEPDASLDKLNLRSAAGALRDLAGDTQIVSVSLRDRFFEYADVLVGVYKDAQSSGVMTLDLGKFMETNLVMEPLD
jgi:structural maintenance of chromosome 1